MDFLRTMVHATPEIPDNPDALLVTATDVARLLNISKRTLWRLLSAGKLPRPVRLGNVVRWRRNELEQWISQGCPSTRPTPLSR